MKIKRKNLLALALGIGMAIASAELERTENTTNVIENANINYR